ncbi:MAG: DUF502 domain-containing protein [Gammaproteobacteria bacterium]|nr:DUF502 domain-containing protein [Gammaproteobacteria bacterium]NND39139.1 DUF502 domain-containing protein [Pseudomonadales bacterium]NNL10836.1 DUF502 domain-containing protein [Pseudomonadales bacterium]NNM11628.1 DUF502 domain-containing protein [Pseudomonadales bacterium]RZV53475.1 MAG: DUF502 domain-containing protein [Pseudomonadales bacterium]
MFQKAGKFLTTILIGGLVVILPVIVIFQAIRWLTRWLLGAFEPLTTLTDNTLGQIGLPAEVLSLFAILVACFAVGLLVRTAMGQWLQRLVERWFLARIPGYEMLRDLFAQLQPAEKREFSRPVLLTLGSESIQVYGFVTDSYGEGHYAVFLPTSPSPLNGYVLQVHESQLEFLQCSADKVMQSVLGCGMGSSDIINGTKGEATRAQLN